MPSNTGRKLKRRLVTKTPYYEDYHGIRNPDEDPHPDVCESESDSDEDKRKKKVPRRQFPGFFKQFHTSKVSNTNSAAASEPKRTVSRSEVLEAAAASSYKGKGKHNSSQSAFLPSPTSTPLSGFHKQPSRKLTPKKGGMFGNIYKHGIDRGDNAPHARTKTATTTPPLNQQSPTISIADGSITWGDLEGGFRYPHANFQPQPLPHYPPPSPDDPLYDLHNEVAEEFAHQPLAEEDIVGDADDKAYFDRSPQRRQDSYEAAILSRETTSASEERISESLKKMREDKRIWRSQSAEAPVVASIEQRSENDEEPGLDDESDSDTLFVRVTNHAMERRLNKLRQENEARLAQFITSSTGVTVPQKRMDREEADNDMSDSPPLLDDNGTIGFSHKIYKGRPQNIRVPGLAETRPKLPYRPLPRSPDKMERSWRFADGDGVRKQFGKKKTKRTRRSKAELEGIVFVMKEVRIPVVSSKTVASTAAGEVIDLTGAEEGEERVAESMGAGRRGTAVVVVDIMKDLGGSRAGGFVRSWD